MSRTQSDIGDDEIRIISMDGASRGKGWHWLIWLFVTILPLSVVTAVGYMLISSEEETSEPVYEQPKPRQQPVDAPVKPLVKEKGFVSVVDTMVNGTSLKLLFPENVRPSLALGTESIDDSTAILIVQAADVRSDNGQIVGAYVLNGELLSKGEAKAGFCSIVNGVLSIGVADATPMLEQALTTGGSFFRQYPLVVGGQIVENKLKSKSVRKALAEVDGRICVAIGSERQTLHDFSQTLIDAGVRTAIYLVGGTSSGFYVDRHGVKTDVGINSLRVYENANYIVWR